MKKRLLAVVAHPDDESFGLGGTLAHYAAHGVDVHVAVATDGVAGSVAPGFEDALENLVAVRKREVQAAVKILGGTLHMLGFQDSGYIGDPANQDPQAFINRKDEETVPILVELIREIKPQVIITHDETGGYFHPDHIHCCQVTTAAFFAAGEVETYPPVTLKPYQPQRLYYSAFPNRMVKIFTLLTRLRGQNPKKMGRNKDIDFTKLGIPPEKTHVKIDYRLYWDVKRLASAQHPSQGGGTSNARTLPPWFQRRYLSAEFFIRAYPPGLDGQLDDDLFTGVKIEPGDA